VSVYIVSSTQLSDHRTVSTSTTLLANSHKLIYIL